MFHLDGKGGADATNRREQAAFNAELPALRKALKRIGST
jgi:hypothetical protein